MVKRINEYLRAKKPVIPKKIHRSGTLMDYFSRIEDKSDKKNKKMGYLGKRSYPIFSKNSKIFDRQKNHTSSEESLRLKKLKQSDGGKPRKPSFLGKIDANKLKEFVNGVLPESIDKILGQIQTASSVSKKDVVKKLTFLETEIKQFIAISSFKH